MREIDINHITSGQKLARDIYNSRGDLLLSKGSVLTTDFINRLKKLNFTYLYVNDGLIDDVTIDEVISEETKIRAVTCLREITESFQDNKELNLSSAKTVVANIIEEVMGNSELLLSLSDIRSFDDYTFHHSVNVTVLSVIVGSCLYYSHDKLLDLGLGVLLHDIGKTEIPLEILNKPSKLTAAEFDVVKKHTWHGFEKLRSNPEIKLTSAHVALQHHERVDGQGYPRGINGNEILEFAKICSIADVYDALSSDRVYRKKLTGSQVVEVLLEGNGTHFDTNILDLFLIKIALYPNGTKVQLNNGSIGFVIKQDLMNPSRPVIRIFWNSNKEYIKPKEIILMNNPHLFIVNIVD